MPSHLVKFFDDLTSVTPTELGFFFANSLDEAMEKAKASLPKYRAQHPASGYRIEDTTGRTVWIGPGTHDDA